MPLPIPKPSSSCSSLESSGDTSTDCCAQCCPTDTEQLHLALDLSAPVVDEVSKCWRSPEEVRLGSGRVIALAKHFSQLGNSIDSSKGPVPVRPSSPRYASLAELRQLERSFVLLSRGTASARCISEMNLKRPNYRSENKSGPLLCRQFKEDESISKFLNKKENYGSSETLNKWKTRLRAERIWSDGQISSEISSLRTQVNERPYFSQNHLNKDEVFERWQRKYSELLSPCALGISKPLSSNIFLMSAHSFVCGPQTPHNFIYFFISAPAYLLSPQYFSKKHAFAHDVFFSFLLFSFELFQIDVLFENLCKIFF